MKKRYFQIALLIVAFCSVFISCKKKIFDECPYCPIIHTLDKSKGRMSDTLTLTGKNFISPATELGARVVFPNGDTALPIFNNDTIIKVEVPQDAGNGRINVFTESYLQSSNGPNFTYVLTAFVTDLIGTQGNNTDLNLPILVYYSNGYIWVKELEEDYILKYDLNGNLIVKIDVPGLDEAAQILSFGTELYLLNRDHLTKISSGSTSSEVSSPFSYPEFRGMTIRDNILYITDSQNNNIVTYDFNGVWNVYASNLSFVPYYIATDESNNFLVTGRGANGLVTKVYKIAFQTKNESLVAGSDGGGSIDAVVGTNAKFGHLMNLVKDLNGNFIVADGLNATIRVLNKDIPYGVSTLAGSSEVGEPSYVSNTNAENARFGIITQLDIDTSGNIYVCDHSNHLIRKISFR